MAQFPQGLSQIDARCNAGERRVLQQLKRCLDDDCVVWHNVPLGPRARQPDFVVLSPRQGLLLLEVKDWKLGTLSHATRDSVELQTPRGRVTEANPLRQARDYAFELVHAMAVDRALVHGEGPFCGKLLFPYGWGVVFSGLRAVDLAGTDFHSIFPRHQLLLRDDLEPEIGSADLQRLLWGMFTVSYPHTLTLPQRDRIRWHLFPELRMATQLSLPLSDGASAVAQALPDLLQVMDLQQEQVARTLGEGHRVIHGAAGSGKTMILIYRAQVLAQAARVDAPVLVLCFNRTLADRIDALLRERGIDERVQVRTFHSWCKDVVDTYQLDVPVTASREAHYQALAQTVERALQTGFVPGGQYTALLVDEAHDFEESWLRMAVGLVRPDSRSLLVLYDDAQSIYRSQHRRGFSFASVGIEARGRTSILRLNYRNTAEVLALAMGCAEGLLKELADETSTAAGDDAVPLVQPSSAGRRGPLPVLIEARDAREEAQLLAERLAQAHAAGSRLSDMAILCRHRGVMAPIAAALARQGLAVQSMDGAVRMRFDWQRDAVRLITLHSAKGLEFPKVFIAGLQELPFKGESAQEALRLLYVGMTRATHELVLSARGDSAVVELVRRSLRQVVVDFAPQVR